MKLLKKLIAAVAFVPVLALASEDGFPLDHLAPRTNDITALQHGAKLFVNYCLNCHGASAMRYNRLKDIGLSEDQIKNNLLFTTEKVGDLMKVSMPTKDAKDWFGATPPDLSVIARAKSSEAGPGTDWLYTYLRTFYKDDTRPTGWNNLVFPNVGMPHVMWDLQGVRSAKFVEEKDPHDPSKSVHKFEKFEMVKAGTMSQLEYDNAVADLVSYLDWMSEPAQNTRRHLGVWVLLFLGGFLFLTWRLNASYWKDVK
ncbi:ubiquinol-cytochrome c reductase cytochrome c1 subunit [Noviherbaspirillum humi]|uniref:Ubiquinol-cytochrome c reductase cytochrome c1 subunit n=1 Tax=Noviherbaspirillum humi TaxID=1688639 RepID=A0A239JBW7_9BURK|nr:cytochrome c1 [Noviherbaspirillum humi]SNT03325.1 ubiquinol-cytochrome c reductase cytochrome c1 subunit [Noviherbaspirillum humi]